MRSNLTKFAYVATLGLALVSTFGCSGEDENGGNVGGNGSSYNYCITANNVCLTGPFTTNTCNGQLSNNCPNGSSSSSSSSSGIVHNTPVTYQGDTYETVVIGNQTWMARNLNYNVTGSNCYNNEPTNCTTYGRLYDWEEAMALNRSCSLKPNTVECTSRQIGTKHQGICPPGWHIPCNDEWKALLTTIGGSSAKLNTYGFSVLRGGYRTSDSYIVTSNSGSFREGNFSDVGTNGYWWSANESASNSAYFVSSQGGVNWINSGIKTDSRSVRCLKD